MMLEYAIYAVASPEACASILWRDATQAYQAEVIRSHVEALRRLKYRPTGGFCQFSMADGQPAVTWSVLDHQRRPKAAWAALRATAPSMRAVR